MGFCPRTLVDVDVAAIIARVHVGVIVARNDLYCPLTHCWQCTPASQAEKSDKFRAKSVNSNLWTIRLIQTAVLYSGMDELWLALVDRFEREFDAAIDQIIESITGSATYQPIKDGALPDELRRLARQHIATFIQAARRNQAVKPEDLDFVRQRAAQRARELIPLPAIVNAHLVAIRPTIEAIARAVGADAGSPGVGFQLAARHADYTVLAVTALVEAYMETVEGERADREADRLTLLEKLLNRTSEDDGGLRRRARSLGLETGRDQVVVVMCVKTTAVDPNDQHASILKLAANMLARASGRSASRAFIVVRPNDLVAVLDNSGPCAAQTVLKDLEAGAVSRHGVMIRAGIGHQFLDLSGFRASYDEAQRALRHATARRPIISSPDDIALFDELVLSSADACERLIPAQVRQTLKDSSLRATLRAYLDADLNVAIAAKALSLHPNSPLPPASHRRLSGPRSATSRGPLRIVRRGTHH